MSLISGLFKGIGSFLKGATKSIPLVGDIVGSAVDAVSGDSDAQESQDRQISGQKELMDYNNSLNMRSWSDQFDAQNARQNWLLQNQATLQKQGLQNAGLSSALMQGGTTSVASVSSPSGNTTSASGLNSPSILDFLRMSIDKDIADANIAKVNAETKNINEDTKNKSRENTRESSYDAVINNADYFDALIQGEDALNRYIDTHGVEAISIPQNKGYQDAIKTLSSWRAQKFADKASAAKDALVKTIQELQLADDKVIKSLKSMPIAEYSQLVNLASMYISQKGLNEANTSYIKEQEDEFKRTKVGQVIDTITDDNAPLIDKLRSGIALLLRGLFHL